MPASHVIPDLDQLLDAVRADALLRSSRAHGEGHWLAVAATGLELHAHSTAARMRAPDPLLVVLFGLLHDCRRENETYDPEHGHRAADVAASLHTCGLLTLEQTELDVLVEACMLHHSGEVNEEHATIGACFDADRLQLPRVGIAVRHRYISTAAGRDPQLGERVLAHHNDPSLSWTALLARAIDARGAAT